jgi:hypothetical protein
MFGYGSCPLRRSFKCQKKPPAVGTIDLLAKALIMLVNFFFATPKSWRSRSDKKRFAPSNGNQQ